MRWTPRDWNPRLEGWNRDANSNYIEDDLETDPGPTVNVILALNRCPTDEDLLRLGCCGTLGYVGRYLTFVQLINVPLANLVSLSNDEAVAMVERDHPAELLLDTSVAAIRVRDSSEYNPDTVFEAYPAIDGSGVTICVIDSGVDDGEHDTLPAWKFVGGYDVFTETETNPDDLVGTGMCPVAADTGPDGHGTYVASVALGILDPPYYLHGVAPGANLADVRIFRPDADNCVESASTLKAFEWVVGNAAFLGIDVVNASFGSGGGTDGRNTVCQTINRLAQDGIVVVAAVGNSGIANLGGPAAADEAITVGWMDQQITVDRSDDVISSSSTLGPRASDDDGITTDEEKPEVCAPGERINAAKADTADVYSNGSGSSVAAPHVAGLAALILQQRPGMTPAAVKELLIRTAEDYDPVGWDPAYGHGYVDGFAAIELLATTPTTDLGFEEHRNSPDPASWSSRDISLEDADVVAGVENTVYVRVSNFGEASAVNFKVRVSVNTLGNNDEYIASGICEVPIDLLAPDATDEVSCNWTPDEVPDGTVHACLIAEVVYISDSDYSNNQAQHNINVKQAASPAVFAFQARNTSGRIGMIDLVPTVRPGSAPWNVVLSMDNFGMTVPDCPQRVEVAATPLVPDAHPIRIDVAVHGVIDQERIPMGGVTFFAQTSPGVDCNGNGIHDWIDIRDGTSRDDNADGVPDSCGVPSPELFGVTFTSGELVRLDLASGAGTLIGSTGRQLRCASADSADRILSISADQLLQIDPKTAAVSLLQSLIGRPANYVVTGLAVNHEDDLFVLMIENTDDSPGDRLYRLDATTGIYTLVGPLGSAPGVTGTRGLAFSPLGVLYAVNLAQGLMIVDQATGTATTIGKGGDIDREALEFDPTTGICYGAKYSLYQIDTLTGAFDRIGSTGGYDVRGTAFLRNGRPRLGDCDGDGEMGLPDWAIVAGCLTGPGGGVIAGCSCMDDGADSDVDLRDVATFQTTFAP